MQSLRPDESGMVRTAWYLFKKLLLLDRKDPEAGAWGTAPKKEWIQAGNGAGCAAAEFTEVSLRGRQDFTAAPGAVLHIGTVTVELFEDTPCGLLETILKAVRSC